jgi:hypothetical protein
MVGGEVQAKLFSQNLMGSGADSGWHEHRRRAGMMGAMSGTTDNGGGCQKSGGAIRSSAESGKRGQWILKSI